MSSKNEKFSQSFQENVSKQNQDESFELKLQKQPILRTFNSELDRKFGGGLKIPTLMLIEGPNDSGKSVLAYQFCYGALMSCFKVCYITTEHSVKSLLDSMESLNYTVKNFFLSGKLHVFELHVEDLKWDRKITKMLLKILSNYMKANPLKCNVFIIDSLTYLLTHAEEEEILNFFTRALNVVSQGISIIITLHDYALSQDLMIRVRSICDTHISLSIREVGGKVVRVMKILKAKGVEKVADSVIGFEIDPAFGFRVIPFSQARL